jgi:hypothetical protein
LADVIALVEGAAGSDGIFCISENGKRKTICSIANACFPEGIPTSICQYQKERANLRYQYLIREESKPKRKVKDQAIDNNCL